MLATLSILHSSTPAEQLSPADSKPLTDKLASFFHEKIISLKLFISSKLGGPPSPFDFDKPQQWTIAHRFHACRSNRSNTITKLDVKQILTTDYIATSLLKSCASTFSILMSHFVNLSFEQATFPSKFKHAFVAPLLKKPGLSRSDTSNFKPISNLNSISKILECLALKRLFPHISLSPSFSPLQSVYRKFHSTETALLKLTNDILDSIDHGKISILAALDMSAAFDTLDHATLLELEHTFDLSGCVISWIHSYLPERSSHVKVDTSSSPRTPSPTGVPQGSVLGPFLFVLFISPISSVIQPSSELLNKNMTVSFHQYADDTQLHTGTNSSTLATQIATLESCTVRVNDWFLQNGLHLNPSKSEAIAFFNPRSKPLATLAESIQSISVAGSHIKLQ